MLRTSEKEGVRRMEKHEDCEPAFPTHSLIKSGVAVRNPPPPPFIPSIQPANMLESIKTRRGQELMKVGKRRAGANKNILKTQGGGRSS